MFEINLSGQVAAVTGGNGAIGKGICESLAAAGVDIAVLEYKEEVARQVAAELEEKYGVKAIGYGADITDEEQIQQVIDKVHGAFGKIDILATAAGISGSANGDVTPHETATASAHKIMDANFFGTVYPIRAALPYMRERKYGRIIIVSSIAGRGASNGRLAFYGAAKSALIHFTQSIARAYCKEGITCNAILPGFVFSQIYVDTCAVYAERWNCTPEEAWKRIALDNIPQGEAQTPEDMGNAALFFASEMGRHITGQSLNVCGGTRMN